MYIVKNYGIKFLLISCSIIGLLKANEIDLLLEQYQAESELSKKTKDENAGHLIVFTRDDLERMQVETLKDVLKSVRYFRYLENRTAEPDIFNVDPVLYNSKSIRIYLNNNELVLPITGSGFSMFGNIDMDFIDHVEIYEGFPSFEFGIEPAVFVVRLYTKSPEHDEGTRIKALVASRSSHKENIYTTGFDEDLAYFIYANHSTNNKKSYDIGSDTVDRDYATNHFYASLAKDNYKIELDALSINHDGFLGILPYTPPYDTSIEKDFINASLESKFFNNSLKLNISYIHATGSYDASYSTPLPPFLGGYKQMDQEFDSDTLTAIIQKKLHYKVHDITMGFQYRYKYFDFDNIKYNYVPTLYTQKYDKESIYSLFIEDSILLSEADLVGVSLMQQYYQRNHGMKNESVSQLRLSYIHRKDSWTSKTFLSYQELVPEPFMTAAVHVGNPDLNPEIYRSVTQEFSYEKDRAITKLVLGYGNTKNFLIPNYAGVMQNSTDNLKVYYCSLSYEYVFRKKDKLELQVDVTNLNLPQTPRVVHSNYLIRMLNSVGKFDIFNEFVINDGYADVSTGFDYSAGIKYAFNSDLHMSLKGENIFNQGLTRKYYYNIFPTKQQLEVPVIEQKFMMSMEYLF